MEITDLINGKVEYDKFGGQYFWIKEPKGGSQMLAEMRGWGHIQNMFPMTKEEQKQAANYQDEIGDSDLGAVYSDVETCQKHLDTDPETEEDIPNFDREVERDCCELDFWQVVEVDEDLSVKVAEEAHTTGKMEETHEMFKARYNCA